MVELIIYLRNAHPSYSASPTNSAHQHQLDLAGQNIRRKLQATTPSTYVPPQSASFQLCLLHQLCCSSAEARSSTVSSASHSIISLLDKTPTHLYLKKTASMFPPQSAPIISLVRVPRKSGTKSTSENTIASQTSLYCRCSTRIMVRHKKLGLKSDNCQMMCSILSHKYFENTQIFSTFAWLSKEAIYVSLNWDKFHINYLETLYASDDQKKCMFVTHGVREADTMRRMPCRSTGQAPLPSPQCRSAPPPLLEKVNFELCDHG